MAKAQAAKQATKATAAPAERATPTRTLFNSLRAEKDKLTAQSAPHRAERDKITAQIQPLEAKHRALTVKIKAIEHPRMADLDMEIGALARALGARTLGGGSA